MTSFFGRYANWLHTRWPAGTVERLPELGEDGRTAVDGVRIVGDLTGVPLLKFSADSGARAVRAILAEPGFVPGQTAGAKVLDLAIVGAGISGIAAALEAKAAGLNFTVFESAEPFSTVANFPKGKPIFTYPTQMIPVGSLQFRTEIHPKEQLLADLEERLRKSEIGVTKARIESIQRRGFSLALTRGDGAPILARRVIVAIGRSGDYRRLNVPGENLDKVFNRLYDPKDFLNRDVLVVGGGDSAVETAASLADAGASVTIAHRGTDFARARPENLARLAEPHRGALTMAFGTSVDRIEAETVVLKDPSGGKSSLANDAVFAMIGREAPLDFFRRSGIPIRGEWKLPSVLGLAAFLAFSIFLFNWKAGGWLTQAFAVRGLFPFNIIRRTDRGVLAGTLAISLRDPAFFYSLAYSLCVVLFGIDRIHRRKSPYVLTQTLTLMAVQVIPLFLLPYILLPYLGHRGAFDTGFARTVADHLFPAISGGQGREYWRAFGLVLAWPLFVWNVFSSRPLSWWLAISLLQTFVLIPLIVRRWGKGAYCGWICSCGALAETMGARHRQKMPHGPLWNRLNMVGQVILCIAFTLFAARSVSWSWPGSTAGRITGRFFDGLLSGWSIAGVQLNYYHVVDVTLAGIVGVGLYFWFSGRVWCRFACPLAALMNIYTRFSRFRIFPEKDKCISCNLCTANCHQGIDVMNFANKGLPMEDPQCVRCSACVEVCPTGVLSFGYIGAGGLPVLDRLPASPERTQGGSASRGKP